MLFPEQVQFGPRGVVVGAFPGARLGDGGLDRGGVEGSDQAVRVARPGFGRELGQQGGAFVFVEVDFMHAVVVGELDSERLGQIAEEPCVVEVEQRAFGDGLLRRGRDGGEEGGEVEGGESRRVSGSAPEASRSSMAISSASGVKRPVRREGSSPRSRWMRCAFSTSLS